MDCLGRDAMAPWKSPITKKFKSFANGFGGQLILDTRYPSTIQVLLWTEQHGSTAALHHVAQHQF
jgi:hypothetical protein